MEQNLLLRMWSTLTVSSVFHFFFHFFLYVSHNPVNWVHYPLMSYNLTFEISVTEGILHTVKVLHTDKRKPRSDFHLLWKWPKLTWRPIPSQHSCFSSFPVTQLPQQWGIRAQQVPTTHTYNATVSEALSSPLSSTATQCTSLTPSARVCGFLAWVSEDCPQRYD